MTTSWLRPFGVRPAVVPIALMTVALVAVSCSSSSTRSSKTTKRPATTTSAAVPTTTTIPTAASVCGRRAAHPAHYDSVVVFSFENRTWDRVGLGFGPGMPFLHDLGQRCSFFTDWTENDTAQNSLTQYVGQITGTRQPGPVDDCSPSPTCSTDANSIFRQLGDAGRRAVNYVEGATGPCSADGNAAKHVPALYLWSAVDRARCDEQVRPMGDLHVDSLPAFAFVTPTLCNDGHDCPDATVDAWASAHIQPVLDSAAYRAGRVAVFVWYDEDHPVPNLWIAPTATPGPITLDGAGFGGTLAAWQSMLGLPCLAEACSAADMRTAANS